MNKQVLIISVDPVAGRGGALTIMQEVYGMHRAWGLNPLLVYFPVVRRQGRWSDRSGLRYQEEMETFGLARWRDRLGDPQQVLSYLRQRKSILQSGAIIVVGGTALAGYPLGLIGAKYVMWIATGLGEELQAQAFANDARAQQMLSWPRWLLYFWQEDLALRRSECVTVMSRSTAKQLCRRHSGFKLDPQIIGAPIHTDVFKPLAETSVQRPYILFTGRLSDPRKNLPLLIQAFHLAQSGYDCLDMVLIGDEPAEHDRSIVNHLGLIDRVRFVPRLAARTELVKYYQQARVFVVPSRQEGLCISALEAMACGVPVVSTRCDGPEDYVVDGETGFLVDGEPGALARAMLRILDSPDLRARMSHNCRKYVCSHYSWTVVSNRFRQVLAKGFPEVYAG